MEWFLDHYSSGLAAASPVAYLLALLAGLLIGVTPCNLPMVPVIVGYVGGYGSERRKTFRLVVAFALGAAAVYGVLGAFAAELGSAVQRGLGPGWNGLLGALCVLCGLFLTHLIKVPFSGGADLSNPRRGGWWAAFALGALISLVSSGCCFAPAAAVLLYAAAEGRPVHGMLTLFAFGLGKSIPLVLVGAGVGSLRGLAKATRWANTIELGSGVVMLAVGFWFLRQAV